MNMNDNEGSCLVPTLSPEQRVLIALSTIRNQPTSEYFQELLGRHLDWPWIIMQAMQHRTICIVWETLKTRDLMKAAAKSGLGKNWITYGEQISRASHKKNQLWLEILDVTLSRIRSAGIDIACIKGSALIGDIYSPSSRMLGDVDTLIANNARTEVAEILFKAGFKHGTINPVTGTVEPMSKKNLRFWTLNSHIMPKFTLETGDPDIPFFRLAVGFNFFDPGDKFSMPSEDILPRCIQSPRSREVYTPNKSDTVLNLCAHIYREATSASFGFISDNWHLWKFCDLREYILEHGSDELLEEVAARAIDMKMERPVQFSLYYTYQVYGGGALKKWHDAFYIAPEDELLTEIKDGKTTVSYKRPFSERLFETRQTIVSNMVPVWSKVMPDGEWW